MKIINKGKTKTKKQWVIERKKAARSKGEVKKRAKSYVYDKLNLSLTAKRRQLLILIVSAWFFNCLISFRYITGQCTAVKNGDWKYWFDENWTRVNCKFKQKLGPYLLQLFSCYWSAYINSGIKYTAKVKSDWMFS